MLPRASRVVVVSLTALFPSSRSGALIILGVAHFLDMGPHLHQHRRTAIAAASISKWEGDRLTQFRKKGHHENSITPPPGRRSIPSP